MKQWYESKTIWVNVAAVVAAILVYMTGPDFPIQLDSETLKALVALLGVVNVALRFVTNTGLTK